MPDPRRAWDTPSGTSARQLMALLAVTWTTVSWAAQSFGVVAPSRVHPALAYVERGIIEMRSDPDASKRDADEALRLVQQRPDADLEIRARLILCDYQAERDTQAAEQQIEAATALLEKAH